MMDMIATVIARKLRTWTITTKKFITIEIDQRELMASWIDSTYSIWKIHIIICIRQSGKQL